ncbi:MAG: hypothetical protein J07HQX50_01449, partial [Haloquadratum sp. J07HQX50]
MSQQSTESDSFMRFVAVGVTVLVIASGGLALTASFADRSVQSDVGVQVDSRFEYPRINQTEIRTSETSRKSILQSANGTQLTVIQESINNSSLTITVPIQNNADQRGVTRLLASSSTSSF